VLATLFQVAVLSFLLVARSMQVPLVGLCLSMPGRQVMVVQVRLKSVQVVVLPVSVVRWFWSVALM
jgi:hypothetical protein